MPQPRRVTPTAEALRLWPGHPAGGVIGPVAVEPDDAPLDAPARADHAGVLGDRIVDGVLAAIRDLDDAAAEAAWNGVGGPGPERGLADLLEEQDAQISRPVHVFALIEARGDLHQRVAVIARRQLAFVLRAGQVEVHFQPVGGAGGPRRQRGERSDERARKQQGAAGHVRTPPYRRRRRWRPTPAESRWRPSPTPRSRRVWRQCHARGFRPPAALQA